VPLSSSSLVESNLLHQPYRMEEKCCSVSSDFFWTVAEWFYSCNISVE
jgi:hypothetical protein